MLDTIALHTKVLLVEDSKTSYILTKRLFEEFTDRSFSLQWVNSYEKALAAMESDAHDIYLLDYYLDSKSGLELLREVRQKGCSAPAILLTSKDEKELAIEAMQAGADDYLVKGEFDAQSLERSIRYALEQARTWQALRDSETRYRNLVETLPIMFYSVEPLPPYSPIYISPAFESLGYPLEQWYEKPDMWLNILHPEDREWVLLETEVAMSLDGKTDFEYRLIAQDGSVRWFHDRGQFIRNESGQLLCQQGFIVDITESRQAEQELFKREKLYRTLAHNIPNTAVLLFDRDFRYTVAEGEQLKKHGFLSEMLEGKTLYDIFPAEICEEWEKYYQRALEGEVTSVERKNKDGYFQIYVVPVKNEDGEIFAGMVMWQDITERRQTEEALVENEERFRTLFENANDVVYIHDFAGNYISINQAAERIFGYTREEISQMNMEQIVAPEEIELARRKLKEKLEGVKNASYEITCLTKDGRRVPLEINSCLIYKNGEPIAIQGIARDITERKLAEEALKEREESYRDLFENANDLIYTHDLNGNFTSLNRAGEIITGYTREEALQMNVSQVVAPEFLKLARKMIASKVTGEAPTSYELKIINKSGDPVSLDLSTRLICQDGKPVGVQGIGRDITSRKLAEEAIKASEESYRLLGEGIMHQVWTAQPDGKLDYTNRRTLDYFGMALEQILEDGWRDVVHPEDLPNCLERWTHSLKSGEYYEVEFRLKRWDGEYRWHLARATAGHDSDGKIIKWFGTNTDIDDKKTTEAKLNYYALHDALTNLPNRAQFMNHLRSAIDRTKGNALAKFAVLFLDLDRFKIINDSLGHGIGDKLLIGISERLKLCVRPGDVVARLGGDEFTILLNRTGEAEDVAVVARRLLRKIAEPFKIDNYEVFTSASIGIIASDNVSREPEDFLRDADAAMYRAKEAGKARYEIFDREMHIHNINLLQMETDLRYAIERNEFEVFYQPIVELESGALKEFEALIRWRHPQHGLVSPTEFITVAEETGLIIPIGRWILEEACRQIAVWQNKFHFPYSVSVNLSAKQLMHPALTEQVREILVQTEINPRQLKLEVTESTVMEHSEALLSVLSGLYALGISFSTDDFGTGYSSLSYLHRFPFERLKIDRSFIKKMSEDKKGEAIVKTILMLGENLSIDVVAEGIETERQLELLRSFGCPAGQGYLFSQPLPADEMEQLLRKGLYLFGFDALSSSQNPKGIIEVLEVH